MPHGFDDDVAIGIGFANAKDGRSSHTVEGLQYHVLVGVDEGAEQLGIACDQRWSGEFAELRNRHLLVVIANSPWPVIDARSLALGRLQQIGRVHIFHVEGGILAHQDGGKRTKRSHQRLPDGVPMMSVVVHGQGLHPSPSHAILPEHVGWLEREQRVPSRLRRAHHGHARILVGLDRVERIDDECKLHWRASDQGDAHATANGTFGRMRFTQETPSVSIVATVPACAGA